MEITKKHKELVECIQKNLGNWRKFIIAIDGFDYSGKSTLARFLSWQTGISLIETDMLLDSEKEGFIYRLEDLRRLIEIRLLGNRPVIIEGVFLLKLLEQIKQKPDYLIYTEKKDHEGSIIWNQNFIEYQAMYRSKDRANFIFLWSETS